MQEHSNINPKEAVPEKANKSWHQVLLWTEISFTAVIAWTAYVLPEISLAVADSADPANLLNWKNASILRSGVIALIYVIFLLAFNVFYVFLLKPNTSRRRMIMIILPLLSFLAVFAGGVLGTWAAVD